MASSLTALVYVTDRPIPSREANGVQACSMADAFSRQGVAVEMLAPRPVGEMEDVDFLAHYGIGEGVRFRYVSSASATWRLRLLVLIAALQWARQRKAIIYTRSLYAAFWLSRIGVPTIFEVHKLPDASKRSSWQLRSLVSHRGFRGLVAISRMLAEDVARLEPKFKARVMTAHDGARLPEQKPMKPVRSEGAEFTVGYVGHLYPGKGIERVVAVAERMPDVRFVVVGGTDEWIQHWVSEALSRNLRNIEFLGYQPPSALPAQLASFDAVLAPYSRVVADVAGHDISRWMSPLKIFEYMAALRPIVASDLPVLREVLDNGRNALLCDPDDTDSWVRALESLRANPVLGEKIAASAWEDLVNEYSWDARAKKLLEKMAAWR